MNYEEKILAGIFTGCMGLFLLAIVIMCSSCGKASAPAHGELIPGPPGVQCYAIVSNDDVAVGGNCK